MRTRDKGYGDYDITEEEKNQILSFCRKSGKEDREIIFFALKELPPYIMPYIYISLIDGKSFEKLDALYNIALSKSDFYGYRRKGIEALKRYMLICGKM